MRFKTKEPGDFDALCFRRREFVNFDRPSCIQDRRSIVELLALLRKSGVAGAYLDQALIDGIEIRYDRFIKASEYRPGQRIALHPDLPEADLVLLLIRELRRHWHHARGLLMDPLAFDPDSAILVNRLTDADLCVQMIAAGWQLKLAGEAHIWQRVFNAFTGPSRIYEKKAGGDFRTIRSGEAAAAAFEHWFIEDYPKAADERIIRLMLGDYTGAVFSGENARTAPCDVIALFGDVPGWRNYIADHVYTIATDSVFNTVRSRKWANFLWFIKFEISWRNSAEKEAPSSSAACSILPFPVVRTRPFSPDGEHGLQEGRVIKFWKKRVRSGWAPSPYDGGGMAA